MPQRVRQEQGSSMFGLAMKRRCQRSSMNGIGEEEAPTTPTETVPLELVLRNPLVGEGFPVASLQNPEMHITSVLPALVYSGFSNTISSPSFSSIHTFPWLFCACMIRWPRSIWTTLNSTNLPARLSRLARILS